MVDQSGPGQLQHSPDFDGDNQMKVHDKNEDSDEFIVKDTQISRRQLIINNWKKNKKDRKLNAQQVKMTKLNKIRIYQRRGGPTNFCGVGKGLKSKKSKI